LQKDLRPWAEPGRRENNMMIEDRFEIARRMMGDKDHGKSVLIRDYLRMSDRGLGDSAKLNQLIKKAEEKSSRVSLFNEFLGSNVLKQVINIKSFPKYKKSLISVSADKILSSRFNQIQKLWFSWSGDVETAQSEEVQVSLDSFKNALVKGYVFLEDKSTKAKMIFAIDFIEGYMTGYIGIYCNESDNKVASQTINDIIEDSIKNNFFKKAKITPNGKFIKPDGTTMDDIILKDEIKRRIKSGTIDMLNSVDLYKKNNVSIKRGILMEGAPGTGKTLIAKALCNQIDSTFIWVTADDVTFPSDISFIYSMARELSPTIVLFEDIDYIGKKRANEGGSYDKITGELLNQMDGVESNEGIITLASSNYPKALDKALRNRPGRFDIRVRFELPDEDLRRKMFDKFLSKTNATGLKVDSLVKKTAGYTGAYIKELVMSSIMLAIEDKSVLEDGTAVLKDKHFDEALAQIEKSRKLDNIVEEE
jgi:AAA+ superfamily predicted ATPase